MRAGVEPRPRPSQKVVAPVGSERIVTSIDWRAFFARAIAFCTGGEKASGSSASSGSYLTAAAQWRLKLRFQRWAWPNAAR
jgi:hypothetical protein